VRAGSKAGPRATRLARISWKVVTTARSGMWDPVLDTGE
jgi:hypothetical protein